jgi:hypothetical protein
MAEFRIDRRQPREIRGRNSLILGGARSPGGKGPHGRGPAALQGGAGPCLAGKSRAGLGSCQAGPHWDQESKRYGQRPKVRVAAAAAAAAAIAAIDAHGAPQHPPQPQICSPDSGRGPEPVRYSDRPAQGM